MKKFLISALFLIGFGAYVYGNQNNTNAATISTTSTNTLNSGSLSGTVTATGETPTATTPKATPAVTTTPKSTGQYRNGTYTGSVANAYYGNIQVAAVISGGKLTDVTFLQYPNDRGESVYINQRAMPALKSEAISAQSARVRGVSGASDTSAAFVESLSSALSQAS
ncbi:hypothetical protein BH11PAT2_BH11PAT2_02120 [soil metagenome]